ncbi:MAG: hypothetical protein D8M59_12440 [Planctomycetes bacterium]|nr:hypothetical protein [Planctomycetota bacterium]NOG53617.1 hypothetical protein [Planctomycetota bacterium]
MMLLNAIYLFGLSALLIIIMFRQHAKGTRDLLSIRNFAIVGFIIFQLTSTALRLYWGRFERYPIWDPEGTALQLSAMATVFLIVAWFVYQRGWIAVPIARRVPTTYTTPSAGTMLTTAFMLTVIAAGLCFGVRYPLIGTIANLIGVGFAAIAAGLVGWVWCRQLINPALILVGSFIVLCNLGNVMMGSFGRRGLVAVGAALIWGMYYSKWRYIPTRSMVFRIAIISVVPIIILALFTSARDPGQRQRTTMQHVQAMAAGNIGQGVLQLLDGQNTGGSTCWVIENYPDRFDYRHMMTPYYFLVYPVPRSLWPNKPMPLSKHIAKQARIEGVNWEEITLPAGIIGAAAAEGGWYALIVYAILAGILLRLTDETIVLNANSPLIVLACGSALGQVMGLARGETSVFAWMMVTTIIGTYVCIVIASKLVESRGLVPAGLEGYEQWSPTMLDNPDDDDTGDGTDGDFHPGDQDFDPSNVQPART